jgi:hypothetical protein
LAWAGAVSGAGVAGAAFLRVARSTAVSVTTCNDNARYFRNFYAISLRTLYDVNSAANSHPEEN